MYKVPIYDARPSKGTADFLFNGMDPFPPEKLKRHMPVVACFSVQRVIDNEVLHPITSTIYFRIHQLIVIGNGKEDLSHSHPLMHNPEVGLLDEPHPLELGQINAIMTEENL